VVTATAAPTVHWETRLFSDPSATTKEAAPGRGLDAPTYAGIDDQLHDARSRLSRVSARAAYQEALYRRALLVDIRPAAQRAVEGEVAPHLGVLVVERNVLEWRFDPRHDARLDVATFDTRVVVLCQEGYTSSLAADALLRLGIHRATDVVGGFRAWREAGLPVAS
jgi:rhodanese-related sulfurtransferase